jgi:hypothetical protein
VGDSRGMRRRRYAGCLAAKPAKASPHIPSRLLRTRGGLTAAAPFATVHMLSVST